MFTNIIHLGKENYRIGVYQVTTNKTNKKIIKLQYNKNIMYFFETIFLFLCISFLLILFLCYLQYPPQCLRF